MTSRCKAQFVIVVQFVSSLQVAKHNLSYLDTSNAVVASTTIIRQEIHGNTSASITKAQEKQKSYFDKSQVHHLVGDFVLFPNIKLHNIKGGRFSYAWLGPHILTIMSPRGVAALTNQDSCALKTK